MLLSILVPALRRARQQTRMTICKSNIRQLYIANTAYATQNDEFYVRAAYDIFDGFGGKNRWHGVRESSGVDPNPDKNTFDPKKGPLRAYLNNGQVKQCPTKVGFIKEGCMNAFEAGCGGYGYNAEGVGSRSYQYGYCQKAMHSSMKTTEIEMAAQTVMFTDTAFVEGFKSKYLIEYSFCKPPFRVTKDTWSGNVTEDCHNTPSIHFRHIDETNVTWCDGHVSAEKLSFSDYFTGEEIREFKIGWFGPDSNLLFKPYK